MSGQVWKTDILGGFMYAPNLSKILRTAVRPLLRFRQQCKIEPAFGKHQGDTFNYNIFSKISTKGRVVDELENIPEGNFTITQGSVKMYLRANSVPYTGVLDEFSAQPITAIIHEVLKQDVAEVMDEAAHDQFDATVLTVCPTGGNSTDSISVKTDGTVSAVNNANMGITHIKLICDEMKERDIPPFDGSNYGCIGRASTFRPFRDELEPMAAYTERGYGSMLNGELGRSYDGIRFFEQTGIASESWTNGKSDAAYFFGADTVTEGIVLPEQLRGKLPGNYGFAKGVAWVAINGFGIVHNQTGATGSRIMKWASNE
jgi:hypothetical protein